MNNGEGKNGDRFVNPYFENNKGTITDAGYSWANVKYDNGEEIHEPMWALWKIGQNE